MKLNSAQMTLRLHQLARLRVKIREMPCTCSGICIQIEGCSCKRAETKAEFDQLLGSTLDDMEEELGL